MTREQYAARPRELHAAREDDVFAIAARVIAETQEDAEASDTEIAIYDALREEDVVGSAVPGGPDSVPARAIVRMVQTAMQVSATERAAALAVRA